MNAKDYLGKVRDMDEGINEKIEELSRLKSLLYSPPGANTEGERVQRSINPDKIGALVAKIVDLEKEIDRMTDDYVDFKKSVSDELRKIENDRYRKALFIKYVKLSGNREISKELGVSEVAARQIQVRAIKTFEKIYHNI